MSHLHSALAVASTPQLTAEPACSPQLPWFGIRTRSNQEKVTAKVLSLKGFDNYLPTYKLRKRWTDRVVESERPLFPGYVFCRFEPKARLPVLTTPGVLSIVGFSNEPAPICNAEIEAVQAVLRSGMHAEPCPFLKEGQRIYVNSGVLIGMQGLLIKKKSEWRMVVSVGLLQRSISVEIDREAIEAVR